MVLLKHKSHLQLLETFNKMHFKEDVSPICIFYHLDYRELLEAPAVCRNLRDLLSDWQAILWHPGLIDELPSSITTEFFLPLNEKLSCRDAIRVSKYAHARDLTSIIDALRYAAACGDHAIVKLLLLAGVDPNSTGPFRCFYPDVPLHAASKFGCCHEISLLLAAGANINATDEDGWNALTFAVANRQSCAAQMLVSHGVLLASALHFATEACLPDMKHLIEQATQGRVA